MREEIEILKDIRRRVEEARMLAKVVPHRSSDICRHVAQLIELTVACLSIMEKEKE